ncbi:MAG TPA: hypothetical protein VGM85_04940 [Paraburkholderia sp.]
MPYLHGIDDSSTPLGDAQPFTYAESVMNVRCSDMQTAFEELADMDKRQPRCVVIAYDENERALQICTMYRDSLSSQMDAAMVVPWQLADENFKLDDEFARKIGGLVFGLLAAHQPELKPYISVTPHPDAIRNPEPPPDK